jgi:hypothetical protein
MGLNRAGRCRAPSDAGKRSVSAIDAGSDCPSYAALLVAAKQVVEAHDAQAAALAAEAIDEAIEAAKHLTAAVARLRKLIDASNSAGRPGAMAAC